MTLNPNQTIWKALSLGEITQHRQETDLWIIIDNKVYDVTRFAPDHPFVFEFSPCFFFFFFWADGCWGVGCI